MQPYIEIVNTYTYGGGDLYPADLCGIGEFTRENIASWLDRGNSRFMRSLLGWEDFHAVCGDVDIPWATEDGKWFGERAFKVKEQQQ